MAQNEKVRAIIASHYEKNDPIGWFEELYKTANGSTEIIPWADQKPSPHLVEWLDRENVRGKPNERAIVVGCGLGDDPEELARRNFNTTAFDVSASAIDWCRKRFSKSTVSYSATDLFAMPDAWRRNFDFVFESYTIQALPRSLRHSAIENVASLVAPGGKLLVVCRGREAGEEEGTLPWPLSREELAIFESSGLRQLSFENYIEQRGEERIRRFRVLYQKG